MKFIQYLIESEQINIKFINNENSGFLKSLFFSFDNNLKYWTLNFGISVPIIVAYKGEEKNPEFIGYIKFNQLNYDKDVITFKADIYDKVKNKSIVLRQLVKELFKKIKNIKVTKLKSSFETPEGEKMEKLISKKLNLKIIKK
jgi:hypothetical protein